MASETMELFRRHAAREQRNAAAAAAAEPAGQRPSSPQQQQQDGSSIQQASPVKQQQQQASSSGVDVLVTVLTQAHWPTQARLALNLPSVSYAWPPGAALICVLLLVAAFGGV